MDPDQTFASESRSVEDELAGDERVKRSAEALRALKPDEARALMLKAEGLSYAEIGERCGWSYTKVNRAITEGRRRFMEVFRAIESGDACERYTGTLAALAGGTATSEEIIAIRPHLRHCMSCRATVRELHMSKLRGLTLVVPAWLLAPVMSLGGLREETERLQPADSLNVADAAATATATPEPEAAAPHAIDLAGHLLATPERLEQFRRFPRLGRVRDEAAALIGRTSSSDVATGIYVASSSSGGGRLATMATVIGFCVSGVGAGALCVATGVVEAPSWIFHREPRPTPPPRTTRVHRPLQHSNDKSARHDVVETVAPHTPPPQQADALSARHHGTQRRSGTESSTRPARVRPKTAQISEFGFESASGSRQPLSSSTRPSESSAAGTPAKTTTDPARKEFGP